METLLHMFYERGGSPNILNMNNETCLHAVCREPGQDDKKRCMLLKMLQWEGQGLASAGDGHEKREDDGVMGCSASEEMRVERVSVNMVRSHSKTHLYISMMPLLSYQASSLRYHFTILVTGGL